MYSFSPHTKAESAKINQNFTDLSTGDADVDGNSLSLFRAEAFQNFAQSGLVWSQVSGLNGAMTTGVAYVKNNIGKMQRVIAPAILTKTFTASKDTYIDLKYDGTITYVEVANGATTGMTLTADSLRIAKVVTSGSAITSVQQVGYDILNNMIYRTKRIILEMSAENTSGATDYNHTGQIVQFAVVNGAYARSYTLIPPDFVQNTKIRLTFLFFGLSGASTIGINYFLNSMGIGDNNGTSWNIASNITTATIYSIPLNIYTEVVLEVNNAIIQKNDLFGIAVRPVSHANTLALAGILLDYTPEKIT